MSKEAPREHSYEDDEISFSCVDYQYMEIIEKMVFMVMSLSVTFSKEKIIELIKAKFESSFSVFDNEALTDFFSFYIDFPVQETFVRQQFTGQYKAQHIHILIDRIIKFIDLIYEQETFHELHGYIQETVNILISFEELPLVSGGVLLPDGRIRDNIVGYTVGYGQKLSQLFFHYIEQLFLSRSDIDYFTSHTRPFFSLPILNIDVLDQKICEVLNPLNGENGMGCGINVLYSLGLIKQDKWARETQEVNRTPNGPGTTFRDMLAFFNNVEFGERNVGLSLWGDYDFRNRYILHSFEYKFDTRTADNLGFFFDFLKKCMYNNSGVIARHNRHRHFQSNIAGHWVIIYKDNNGDIYTYDPTLRGFHPFQGTIKKKYFDAYTAQEYVSVSIMKFTAEIVQKELTPDGNYVGGSIHSKNSKSTAATSSLSSVSGSSLSTAATDSLSTAATDSLSNNPGSSLSNNPGSSLSNNPGSSQQDHYDIQQTPSENDIIISNFYETILKANIDKKESTPQNKVESFDGLNQVLIENKIINSRMSSNKSKKRGKGKKNRNGKSKRKTRKGRTRRGKR